MDYTNLEENLNLVETPARNPFFPDIQLTDEESQLIQMKLWQLLAYQTERYTMGESSSVRVETAEELFRSICFTLQLCIKKGVFTIPEILQSENLKLVLNQGVKLLEQQVINGKKLLLQVIQTSPPIENISYSDTLASIQGSFKKYDRLFNAHVMPAEIDYQLCHPVSETVYGIEYVNKYLRRLLIENKFLAFFDSDVIISLLQCYIPDYKRQLINLYEPVVTNAVGLALRNKDIHGLNTSSDDEQALLEMFSGHSKAQSIMHLEKAALRVCSLLGIQSAPQKNYLTIAATDLYPRIESALPTGRLNGVFLNYVAVI